MKKGYFKIRPLVIAGACIAGSILFVNWDKATTESISAVERVHTNSSNKFYVSNKAPLQPSQFIKLPAGSIRPKGWILKYLELQRDGLTGHLGEISAWLNKNNNAWFSGTGKG